MNKKISANLFWQPFMATLIMILVLFSLNEYASSQIIWAVGAGSLASSCFIVFTKPSNSSSWPSKILGGYVIGILTGELIRWIIMAIGIKTALLGVPQFPLLAVLAAFSVGIAMLLMTVFNLQHPPAAGMALVLVLEMHDYYVIVIILAAAALLALIRHQLFHYLRDLY